MKKVLIIAIAVLCVAACGPRRSAKSQEVQKDACQKENVEQPCCGHHVEGTCPDAVNGKCDHSQKAGECAKEAKDAVQEVVEAGHKAENCAKETAKCVKETTEEGAATVEQLGRKADPKPIKPVPKPKK
ncbi:MAG: hypothetical protein J5667_01935 [Bacteroidales bacterium]|nr:hypothetical protein [Bacteroidales bacterium]